MVLSQILDLQSVLMAWAQLKCFGLDFHMHFSITLMRSKIFSEG